LTDAATGARLRDSVRFEVGVFILIVLFAGLLAYVPPRDERMTMPNMPNMPMPSHAPVVDEGRSV
jgi:hypothetical protein